MGAPRVNLTAFQTGLLGMTKEADLISMLTGPVYKGYALAGLSSGGYAPSHVFSGGPAPAFNNAVNTAYNVGELSEIGNHAAKLTAKTVGKLRQAHGRAPVTLPARMASTTQKVHAAMNPKALGASGVMGSLWGIGTAAGGALFTGYNPETGQMEGSRLTAMDANTRRMLDSRVTPGQAPLPGQYLQASEDMLNPLSTIGAAATLGRQTAQTENATRDMVNRHAVMLAYRRAEINRQRAAEGLPPVQTPSGSPDARRAIARNRLKQRQDLQADIRRQSSDAVDRAERFRGEQAGRQAMFRAGYMPAGGAPATSGHFSTSLTAPR